MLWMFFKKFLFSKKAQALIRRISRISLVTLSLSITSLVLVISVMTALNRNIRERLWAIEPHVSVEFSGLTESMQMDFHPVTKKIQSTPGVRFYSVESQDVILRTLDGHFRGAMAKGLNASGLNQILKSELNSDEVILGMNLAYSLGALEGEEILMIPPESLLLPPGEAPKYARVRIKKIISSQIADVDSQNLFYNKDFGFKKMGPAASLRRGLEIWLPNVNQAKSFANSLSSFEDISVKTWDEKNSALFLSLRLEKFVITLFLGLAALIASFSMVSVLVLLISQKRKEIGLLQAMGLSSRKVLFLFFKLGFLLSFIGLMLGLFIGTGLAFYMQEHPLKILPSIYYDSEIPALIDWKFLFIVFIVGVLVALIGAFLSARKSLEVSPSESLR